MTSPAIHVPDCAVWDVPDGSTPDALLAGGFRDERIVLYLLSLRPLYDVLNRCLGQLAGLLLLSQIGALEPLRGAAIREAAAERLAELAERVRAIAVPERARQHFTSLEHLVDRLESCALALDRRHDVIDPSDAELGRLIASLSLVREALLAAAVPRAGLAPLDFRGACCNCRPTGALQAH